MNTSPLLEAAARGAFRAYVVSQFTEELSGSPDLQIAIDLFDNYLDGGGDYTFSQDELLTIFNTSHVEPIDIRAEGWPGATGSVVFSQAYNTALQDAQQNTRADYTGSVGWAVFNGTLGFFTANFDGEICCDSSNNCSWTGTISVSDGYNFNPVWNNTHRTSAGERNVRRAYIVNLGTDFTMSGTLDNAYVDLSGSGVENLNGNGSGI